MPISCITRALDTDSFSLRNALGAQAKPLPIIPGMTATVEVMTGHKSVLDYLLKVQEGDLRER